MVVETALLQKIASQAELVPPIYGRIDFSNMPERFTVDPDAEVGLGEYTHLRTQLLANKDIVEKIRAYTLLGDTVADPYAALMPEYGFRRLVGMLTEACDHGVEALTGAPPELVRFIRHMEQVPGWLNLDLVDEGARIERNAFANRVPFMIRGSLFATFMNKYSALPMAVTGTLSNSTSARRIKETATFFTTSVMPGALHRYGAGFKAAAMVRLMHSMVRFNVMRRGDHWNATVYGVPIPQVDQMPAGMLGIFMMSRKVLKDGRTTFSPAERARAELARYRCFLLGLPEDLLADNPQGISDVFLTRQATLRHGFDESCRALVEATMSADLTLHRVTGGRFRAFLERRFSKVYFLMGFLQGDRKAAAKMGISVRPMDYLWAAVTATHIALSMAVYSLAAWLPFARAVADRSLIRKLELLLQSYGQAEFTTDAHAYQPSHV